MVALGTRERLAPILTTALASGAAFMVLAIFGPRIGQEIIQPMAIVILGGLLTSTLISVLVLPALYTSLGTKRSTRVRETAFDVTAAPA